MSKYRVFGAKSVSYWTVVEAEDNYEALDKANELNSVDWIEIETDDVIEAVEVYEEEADEA